MKRDTEAKERDSGWYVGVSGDELDMDDPSSFVVCSLYEISIKVCRISSVWVVRIGTLVASFWRKGGLIPKRFEATRGNPLALLVGPGRCIRLCILRARLVTAS